MGEPGGVVLKLHQSDKEYLESKDGSVWAINDGIEYLVVMVSRGDVVVRENKLAGSEGESECCEKRENIFNYI